ncbi:PorP/SprF family type IX secretion system membrane protein [Pedobacter sp. L105]|uniref:PorP/SprF family type IX secretion system membrane protein n=1 Tax=Pedobacter sp. L105 TaxID=1641871 RepID=UPI00131C012C|nr:PorP/SprF family type IX secretion system membrane protein [Pedobacter sp. L105]
MKNQAPSKISFLKITKNLLATVFLMGMTLCSKAQLSPFQAMYFQNKYIYNPAMAGMDHALDINAGYRKQWSNFPGTPRTGYLTADFQPTDKVGLGLNVTDDQTGLIKSTRVVASYAYHIQLEGDNQHLSFGLSLGVNDSRIDYSNINGDISDVELNRYSELKPYLDGDFGVAYTSNNFYLGAALPNLKTTLSQSSDQRYDADRVLFVGIASYKFPVGDGGAFKLEPLAGLRIVKGYTDIVDAGFNFDMERYGLYFQSIYHSSSSLGLGFGLDQKTYAFSFSYNLETGQLTTYTNGTFEIGFKLRLFGK